MNFILVFFLSSVSVVDAPGSQVIGSHEPVRAAVGDDVILPCRLEPLIDMSAVTVEWTRNKTFVHVFRNMKDNPDLQDENFRGRTSLFLDELVKGNISLKLTNVTEQDAGNYSCFVPKLDSQVRRGFINLRVEPAGERNKGNQTNNQTNNSGRDSHPSQTNTNVIITFITVIAVITIIFCAITIILSSISRRRRAEYDLVQMDDLSAGRDKGEPQEENEEAVRAGDVQPGQDRVEPQENEEAVMDGDVQPDS